MKLSFILPIFNTGKYLGKCIESALSQDIKNDDYEILLVYDQGSTDNSFEIAQAYASRYENIRLISHSNRSIGESLNYAFPLAQGNYIEIIDTDDFLEPGKIGRLVSRMENEHLDILRFDYQNVNENYEVFFPHRNPKAYVDYSDTVTDGVDFLINRFGCACYVPTLIFKRSLLLRSGNEMLSIPINDAEWLPRIIPQARRISSSSEIVYNYLVREGSKMHTSKKQRVESLLEVLQYYSLERSPKLQKWYNEARASIVISILSELPDNSFNGSRKEYFLVLKKINNTFLSFRKKTIRNKLRIIFINISPRFYVFILKCLRQK